MTKLIYLIILKLINYAYIQTCETITSPSTGLDCWKYHNNINACCFATAVNNTNNKKCLSLIGQNALSGVYINNGILRFFDCGDYKHEYPLSGEVECGNGKVNDPRDCLDWIFNDGLCCLFTQRPPLNKKCIKTASFKKIKYSNMKDGVYYEVNCRGEYISFNFYILLFIFTLFKLF
jgi:hypothetical protein